MDRHRHSDSANTLPLVSVIIPAYNAKDFILETLESVINQTYQQLEILVIDDGSTDSTASIVQAYGHGIKLLQKMNGGPAEARNHGLKKATGQFIAFLDADDIWLPEKIESDLDFFAKNSTTDLLCSGCIRFDEKGNESLKSYAHSEPTQLSYELLWEKNSITTSTVVCKKTCFKEAGYFDESLQIQGGEDYDLWLRIANFCNITHLNSHNTLYRVRTSGHNRSNIVRTFEALLHLYRKHGEIAKKNGILDSQVFEKKSELYKSCGFTLFNNNEFLMSKKYLLKYSKHYKFDVKVWAYIVATHFPYLIRLIKTTS